jgi:hypothetical protein
MRRYTLFIPPIRESQPDLVLFLTAEPEIQTWGRLEYEAEEP